MKKEETKIVDLYDLSHTQAADFLRQFTYPWEALAHIKAVSYTHLTLPTT